MKNNTLFIYGTDDVQCFDSGQFRTNWTPVRGGSAVGLQAVVRPTDVGRRFAEMILHGIRTQTGSVLDLVGVYAAESHESVVISDLLL